MLKQTKNYFACLFFGLWGSSRPKKPKNKWAKYFFVCLSKKWWFSYNLSYPHLRFWIFWILKIFGLLLAKFLALAFSKGSKKLAYSFKWYFWAYMWIWAKSLWPQVFLFFLIFTIGLKWGVPPGGGYGCQGGLLFFVGAFGG